MRNKNRQDIIIPAANSRTKWSDTILPAMQNTKQHNKMERPHFYLLCRTQKTAEQNGTARGICEKFWTETRRSPAGTLGGFQGTGTQTQFKRAAKPRRRDIFFCANKKASIRSKTAHRPLKNTVYPLPRQLAQEQ